MQLDHGMAPCPTNLVGQTRETIEVNIVVCPKLPWKAKASARDGRRARHGQSEPAACTHGEPFKLVIAQPAVRKTLQIGERRQHKAIFQRGTACKRNRIGERDHAELLFMWEPKGASALKLACNARDGIGEIFLADRPSRRFAVRDI
jgi:hypothetical protein